MQIRKVSTSQGQVRAVAAPLARSTYVPLPTRAAGQSARTGANVPAVLSPNARATHVR